MHRVACTVPSVPLFRRGGDHRNDWDSDNPDLPETSAKGTIDNASDGSRERDRLTAPKLTAARPVRK